jgi:hypothetical protein
MVLHPWRDITGDNDIKFTQSNNSQSSGKLDKGWFLLSESPINAHRPRDIICLRHPGRETGGGIGLDGNIKSAGDDADARIAGRLTQIENISGWTLS